MNAARPESIDADVVQVVSELVSELRGRGAAASVTLDRSLERDLGISSLERVELVGRLERTFGVRLPEEVLAGAADVRALARAVEAAGTIERRKGEAPALAVLPDRLAEPPSADTLVDALEWHATTHGERTHLLLRLETGDETLTYGELWREASRAAAGLRARGVGPRDTVAIMLRTERAFFTTFFGALLAGAVPVPLYPPFRADRIEEYARRQTGILANAESRVLVTFGEIERVARLLRDQVPALGAVATPDDLARSGATAMTGAPDTGAALPRARATSADGALIQYTSGSTGDPKGVWLTHANLLANIRALGQALAVRDGDVTVSWLPLYHDMGLIGAWLGSLYFGAPLVVMSPLTFLSRPARWLQTCTSFRGTISAAPNFAYDLCTRRITDEELAGLDLRSVRALLNGAEAVLPETLERFAARFAPCGLRREALYPVYGLAESSVGLAIPPLERGPAIDRIDRDALQRSGEAVPAAAGAEPATIAAFVACGQPLPGHEIRVVDDEGRVLGERREGHIEFRGPSVTAGYYRHEAATAAIRTSDGWTRSGDRGYLADGQVHVTGRLKDIIIKGGRNIYPQEVEDLAGSVPGVRQGCVAAFGDRHETGGTERLIVVAETRETNEAERERIRHGVVDRVAAALGVPPDLVVLAYPGAVLKTSSGKIRRSATRELYVRGDLEHGPRSTARQWTALVGRAARGRARRVADVGGRTLYTAWIGAWLALSVPLLLAGAVSARSPLGARRWLRRWAGFLLGIGGVSPRVDAWEQVPAHGPCVYLANHASYIDAAVMLAVLPADTVFAVKAGLVEYPVLGTVIRRCDYVRMHRGAHDDRLDSANETIARLRQGATLFVFPEGTFIRAPGLLPFRLGAFRAAAEAGVPVVPLALDGTRTVLPDGTWLARRAPIVVTASAPLSARGTDWASLVRLRDEAQAAIASRTSEGRGVGDPETQLFSEFD